MKDLIEAINKEYSEIVTESYGKAHGGYLSENYIVGGKERKYFLKQYRSHYSEQDIKNIHKVKKYLSENGIPVVLPINSKNNESFISYNTRYFALFPFIEAKSIKPEKASTVAVKSMARMQAKIHLLSRKELPMIHEKETSVWDGNKALEKGEILLKIVLNIKKLNKFDKMALKYIKFKLKLIKANNITPQSIGLENDHLIHGDFHGLNLFFDDDDEVKYVFDLEKTVIAPRSYELARAMDYICLNDFNFKKAGIYLSTYREIYPMSDVEFRKGFLFYYLKGVHTFWIEEFHYLDNFTRTDVFYKGDNEKLEHFSEDIDGVIDKIVSSSVVKSHGGQ